MIRGAPSEFSIEKMISLQPLGKDGKEVSSHTEHGARETQENEAKVTEDQVHVTTGRWKRVSITATTLLGYAFLNAGISMISPFYPTVVSDRTCSMALHL